MPNLSQEMNGSVESILLWGGPGISITTTIITTTTTATTLTTTTATHYYDPTLEPLLLRPRHFSMGFIRSQVLLYTLHYQLQPLFPQIWSNKLYGFLSNIHIGLLNMGLQLECMSVMSKCNCSLTSQEAGRDTAGGRTISIARLRCCWVKLSITISNQTRTARLNIGTQPTWILQVHRNHCRTHKDRQRLKRRRHLLIAYHAHCHDERFTHHQPFCIISTHIVIMHALR